MPRAELAPWIPRGTWTLGVSPRKPRVELKSLRERIMQLLRKAGAAGLAFDEVVDRTEADSADVSKALQALKRIDRIEVIVRQHYRVRR